jgi:hypothetical protein
MRAEVAMAHLLAPSVWTDITTQAKAATNISHVAVAYFGPTGDRLLPIRPGSLLVADATIDTVKAGSTDPTALRRLKTKGVRIFSAQSLHAKVFAFDTVGFVGSANASTNSQKHLIEAVFRVTDAAEVQSIRDFVESICVTELSDSDLVELAKYYAPPPSIKVPLPAKQPPLSTLIMELTWEQGPGRETQVQPPKPVWENYFQVDLDGSLPLLSLTNLDVTPHSTITLAIVKHDHNFTLEIAGAHAPRPAILELRKLSANAYGYRVHREGEKRFSQLVNLLNAVKNPLWTHGRLWRVI